MCISIFIAAFIRLKESTSIAECYACFDCLQIHHFHVNYGHLQSPICPTTAMERKQRYHWGWLFSAIPYLQKKKKHQKPCISLALNLPYSFTCQNLQWWNQSLSGEETGNKIINTDGKWTCQLNSILSIKKSFQSTAVMARQDFFFIYSWDLPSWIRPLSH